MNWVTNPFAELYPTERIKGDEFVGLFSSSLINSATNLYGKGNTILEGVQGSGKSMLLALLSPEIRLAYAKSKQDFPVPSGFRNFISAGINLTQDGAKGFSNLRAGKNPRQWQEDLPLFFADYFNYVIFKSLLETLRLYTDRSKEELFGLEADITHETLDSFAVLISKHECWFGYLDEVDSFGNLNNKISERLQEYGYLLSLNKREPSETLSTSKTVIAAPIFEVVSALKKAKVISNDVNVIVSIDQYEELDHMSSNDESLIDFRRVINQALHYRDDRVSFKIGTRGYAWKHNREVYGSYARIEQDRDYHIIRIYDLLRQREYSKNALFKKLCQEAFEKRLIRAEIEIPTGVNDIFDYVFGKTPSPTQKAQLNAGDKPEKVFKVDDSWPDQWTDFLKKLSHSDPLSAHMGAAWSRQKGKSEIVINPPNFDELPWESDPKKYWKKERVQQSLIQMASNRQEATIIYGTRDVLGVSGANILAFLTVCQKIWAVYIANGARAQETVVSLPKGINRNIQSAGIKEASRSWYEKISELPGGGVRKRFVNNLARSLYKDFVTDLPMSNPGKTGVSLTVEEFEDDAALMKMLDDCTDYSILDKKDHTSKLADKKPRIKFYLEPILCPFFKLPYQQTKEPAYTKGSELLQLIDNDFFKDNEIDQLDLGL